jgi:hypothetical protein
MLCKGTLLIEQKGRGKYLERAYRQAIDYFPGLSDDELPRWVLVADFWHFELHDLDEDRVHQFTLRELPAKIHLFHFIAGYTHADGSDLGPALEQLFSTPNRKTESRQRSLAGHLRRPVPERDGPGRHGAAPGIGCALHQRIQHPAFGRALVPGRTARRIRNRQGQPEQAVPVPQKIAGAGFSGPRLRLRQFPGRRLPGIAPSGIGRVARRRHLRRTHWPGVRLPARGRRQFKDIRFGAEAQAGLGGLFGQADAVEIAARRAVRRAFVSTNSISQGEQVGVPPCCRPNRRWHPGVRRFLGAEEFINDIQRWCLWLKGCPPCASWRAFPRCLAKTGRRRSVMRWCRVTHQSAGLSSRWASWKPT